MSSYQLTVQFLPRDAKKITDQKQKVTLVKRVHGGGAKVSWVTFEPFTDNIIEWKTEYGLYSSTQEVVNGTKIEQNSDQNPAESGVYYPFEDNVFGAATGNAGKNNYGISNHDGVDLTFGMAQAVNVRGQKQPATPLSATTVFQAEKGTFTPIEEVKVFLQGDYNNGVIITRIDSPSLTVDLTKRSTQTIHYNGRKGRFETGPIDQGSHARRLRQRRDHQSNRQPNFDS